MRSKAGFCTGLYIGLFVFGPASSFAANLYRYEDDTGRMTWGTKIPPQHVSKGYSIIDSRGRVLQVIPPSLSVEEQAEQALKLEEVRLAEEARAKQRERDNLLIRRYRSPTDISEERDKNISDLAKQIAGFVDNIQRATNTVDSAKEEISWEEENGRPVPAALRDRVTFAEREIIRSESRIADLRKEVEDLRNQAESDMARLSELLNLN